MLNKKQIILIISIIVVAFALFGFYYLNISGPQKQQKPQKEVPTTTDRSDYDIYPQDEKDEKEDTKVSKTNYSHNYEVMEKVIHSGDSKYCQELNGVSFDQCLYSVATSKNEEKYCQNIEGDKLKKKCEDQFAYKKYIEDGDYKGCQELEYFQNQCLFEVFKDYSSLNECRGLQDLGKKLCLDIVYRKKAVQEQNRGLCDKIINKRIKYDCIKLVENNLAGDSDGDGIRDKQEIEYGTNPYSPDTDGDGLTDKEEAVKYHTDPSQKDTDGDGYSDGDEIRTGYNPLGEGKLEQK